MDEQHILHNLEEFKNEVTLAMSLTDSVPVNRHEQDRRSKNRFREHSGDGHNLVDSVRTSRQQPNHTLHNCTCGWVGWLIPKE